MSDQPPNHSIAIERDIEAARARLESLGIAVPEPCLPGVVDNLALLERHWRTLRGTDRR